MKVCAFVVKDSRLIEIDYKKVQKLGITAIALTSSTMPVSAETINIGDAFDPIIKVITDLVDPVAYASFVKGGLMFMIGNEHEGKKAMGNTVKGYLVIKFIPQILDLLSKVVL